MKLLLTSTLEYFGKKLPLVFGDNLKDMNVLCIPTAAYAEEGYEEWLMPELESVKHQVRNFTEFDIKNKSKSEFEEVLEGKDVLYVTGGNTFSLLEAMNKIDFKTILNSFFKRGGVYLGSSAGSIVTCPDIEFVSAADDVGKASLNDYTGLNLVDFSLLPHLDNPHFQSSRQDCIKSAEKMNIPLIGLKDDQALWVEGNYIRIY